MTDTAVRYLELADHVGIDYAGNPEPICEIGISIPHASPSGEHVFASGVVKQAESLDDLPLLTVNHKQEIVPVIQTAHALPDTRIVACHHPLVAETLIAHGLAVEIREPDRDTIAKHHEATKVHKAALADRAKRVAAGDEPAPDATDRVDYAGLNLKQLREEAAHFEIEVPDLSGSALKDYLVAALTEKQEG